MKTKLEKSIISFILGRKWKQNQKKQPFQTYENEIKTQNLGTYIEKLEKAAFWDVPKQIKKTHKKAKYNKTEKSIISFILRRIWKQT